MERKYHIAAFTGHRSYTHTEDERLRQVVNSLYDMGVRRFRIGMAEGFDLAAGEAVLSLKECHNDVEIECIIPWQGFVNRFGVIDLNRYNHILNRADSVHYTSERYFHGVYHRRNDMLVEGADIVIAWWNGSRSGTEYTLRRARSLQIATINLYPSSQLTLELE